MGTYKTGFTKDVWDELKARGASVEIFIQLAEKIEAIPRKEGLAVDSSDNIIKVLGYPISFVRNHPEKTIYVMTNEEAFKLDLLALNNKIVYLPQS